MGIFGRRRREDSPATLEDLVAAQADRFVQVVEGPGASLPAGTLDFGRASLDDVDAALHDFHVQGAELPDELHGLAAAYLFEVARREFGGRYLRGDTENPLVLVVGEPDAAVGILGFAKVRGRVVNGPEDNLGFFYDGISPALARGGSVTLT
jgi:hypothetical protein